MTTVRTMITRSMKLLGVLAPWEDPTPEEATDAMATFNDMLNQWRQKSVDLEFFEFATLDDAIPYPQDHMLCFRYNLALHLAPEFGVTASNQIAGMAGDTFTNLQAVYMNAPVMELPDFFIRGANRRLFTTIT